jgi:hypothetical protein
VAGVAGRLPQPFPIAPNPARLHSSFGVNIMAAEVTTLPWPEVRAVFEDHVASGIKNAPLLKLIHWIERENLTVDLFATPMHAHLVIASSRLFRMWEHMIDIRWTEATRCFTFEYYNKGCHPEMSKTVEEAQGTEMLREMLAYKFGLYRRPETEPAVAPNGGPATVPGDSEPKEGRHRGVDRSAE